jgi:hypothetical protein
MVTIVTSNSGLLEARHHTSLRENTMAKVKKKSKTQSPYVKYDKVPYSYSFKKCTHKTEVSQSVPLWSGKVCTSCNTITGVFDAKR